MAAAAGQVEVAPRVEARGVGLRAGLVTAAFLVAAVAVGLAVGPVHVGVGDDIASRWGPRIVEFAQQVAKIARKTG